MPLKSSKRRAGFLHRRGELLSRSKRQNSVERGVSEDLGNFTELAARLVEVGREFYRRGWVLGTSGNFSAVVNRDPLRLAITASGLDKGALTREDILQVDAQGHVAHGTGHPSAETLLHLTLAELRGAQAVLHTHSVWSTLLSERFVNDGGLCIEGLEMLKGLAGVETHEHREWLPIVENSQDMEALSRSLELQWKLNPLVHGFLIRGHGLYTWGRSLAEAKRHVEILEFLLEVMGRKQGGERGRKG